MVSTSEILSSGSTMSCCAGFLDLLTFNLVIYPQFGAHARTKLPLRILGLSRISLLDWSIQLWNNDGRLVLDDKSPELDRSGVSEVLEGLGTQTHLSHKTHIKSLLLC